MFSDLALIALLPYVRDPSSTITLLSRIVWNAAKRYYITRDMGSDVMLCLRIINDHSPNGIPIYLSGRYDMSYIPYFHDMYVTHPFKDDDVMKVWMSYRSHAITPQSLSSELSEIHTVREYESLRSFKEILDMQYDVDVITDSSSHLIFNIQPESEMKMMSVYLYTQGLFSTFVDLSRVKTYTYGIDVCVRKVSGDRVVVALYGLRDVGCGKERILPELLNVLSRYKSVVILLSDDSYVESIPYTIPEKISKEYGIHRTDGLPRYSELNEIAYTTLTTCRKCYMINCVCSVVCSRCNLIGECKCMKCRVCTLIECICGMCQRCKLHKSVCPCMCPSCNGTQETCACTILYDHKFCRRCSTKIRECRCGRCRQCGRHHIENYCGRSFEDKACKWCTRRVGYNPIECKDKRCVDLERQFHEKQHSYLMVDK